MRVLPRLFRDASLQLVVLGGLGLLALVFAGPSSDAPARPQGHPADCHVCSTVPPGATAQVEKFLLAHGYVDRAREDN